MTSIKVGDVFTTNQGGDIQVIFYKNAKRIRVKFLDEHGYEKDCASGEIHSGEIKNPYRISFFGVAYLGAGKFKTRNRKKSTNAYSVWRAMLARCYGDNKSYQGVYVCSQWLSFQNFAEWYYSQEDDNGYHLDKDLLSKDSKVYSPKTCILLPQIINNALVKYRGDNYKPEARGSRYYARICTRSRSIRIGSFASEQDAITAYEKAKESYIRGLAQEWRGRIDERVYDALMNWTVN